MPQIFAIAILSIRSAIRSKIVASLLALLLLAIVFLPMTIKGDGTMAGFVQILLSYTLGFAGFILALTALWSGSAAVAMEINDKTIQMIAAKPVSRRQLWLGKWAGLSLLNAALLTVCGAVTFGLLHWHLHPSRIGQPESQAEAGRLLSAREARTPQQPDFLQLAARQLNEELARTPLPEGMTRNQRLREIEQRLIIEHNTLRPAGRKRWEFAPIPGLNGDLPLTLRYRFSSSVIQQTTTRGRWLVGTPERIDLIDVSKDSIPNAFNELTFSIDRRWENQPLILTFVDMDDGGASLIFHAHEGVVLLAPRGGFLWNYVRALLILFGQLTFYTALGVTAGCLFSLPVASLVSLFLLILIQMGSYIETVAKTPIILPWQAASPDEIMSWGAIAVAFVFKSLSFLMSPLFHESALDPLSSGRWIDWIWTFRGFVLQGLVYSLLMGVIAAAIMNRRELALPQA